MALADLLGLDSAPQASLGGPSLASVAGGLPQAAMPQEHHGMFSGGFGVGSPLRNFIGALADALSVAGGGQPLYQQRLKEQRSRSAVSQYLGNIDPDLAGLLGSGLDAETAVKLYGIRHPSTETPAALKEFEYYKGLQGNDRGSYENFLKLTHPGMFSPVTMGPNDTIEDPSAGSGEVTATNPTTGEKVRYNSQTGAWEPMGGQTAKPSGGFSVTTRNNNPGALRVPGSMRFQSFATPQAGVHAQEAQLGRYFGRGLNKVSSIIETYAPRKSRGGDNTDEQVNNYIGYVSKRLGVHPADTLEPAHLSRLAQAMREFETGQRAY